MWLLKITDYLAHCRENPYYLLTDWVPEVDEFGKPDIRHEVHRQLDLVASIGCRTADELAFDYHFQILFTGNALEIKLVESIRHSMGSESFSLAGKLDIEKLSALLSLAPLLISNNTGPVHLAAILNTPVVDLYALTNPQHTPWNVPHRTLSYAVPCKFCYQSICPMEHHNCLRLVSHQAVVKATLDLLGERTRSEITAP